MKDIFSRDNILIQAAADEESGSDKKKGKKGDGINAVLVFMRELRDFQEKLDVCIEAQDIGDIATKLQSFDTHLDEMYSVLLEIASGGISSIRQKRTKGQEAEGQSPAAGKPPVMMGAPSVPKLT